MVHLARSIIAKRSLRVLVIGLLCMPTLVTAAIIDDQLYTVQLPVLDQSDGNRQAAARQALLQVLSRVTGLSTIPRHQRVSDACLLYTSPSPRDR